MKPVVRTILAVVAGLVVGSAVNMAVIAASGSLIPPPAGADLTTLEGLRASMHLMEPRHFILPFLAHALGTLAGAGVAATIAARHRMAAATVVGVFFLAGGVANALLVPAPGWFIALDLVAAYLPMAWAGGKLGTAGTQRAVAVA